MGSAAVRIPHTLRFNISGEACGLNSRPGGPAMHVDEALGRVATLRDAVENILAAYPNYRSQVELQSRKEQTEMKVFVRGSLVVIALIGFIGLPAAHAEDEHVVAMFKLAGPMTDAPAGMGLGPIFASKEPPNLFGLLEKLKEARTDPKLQAVIFEIDDAQLGFAQIQELKRQIEALKAADKDVWIFTESLSNGSLTLGSSASQLVLVPIGDVWFNGLYGEGLYFKNLLDKIGVQADILHCGAYKAAGEPFYRTGPSEEAEEQNNKLFDSIFETMIKEVADSRGLTIENVRELVDRGQLNSQEALEAKLVDKLQYREDFIRGIKRNYGEDVKVVKDYGSDKGPSLDFGNPFAVFTLFGDMMKGKEKSKNDAVAVVFVEGTIATGETEPSLFGGSSGAGSDTVRRAIAEAAADKTVKALVLRVNSPGGSAIASDIICEATKRFKESGRPFIVSMGNVAASGGYYVSTMADTIIAEPSTITGSIGVVGGKMVTKGLWDWVGVTSHEYKRGKHADLLNTNRPFSDEERTKMMSFMDHIYGEFKKRVLEGRADKIQGELEPLAGGRVYTGEQALKIGLVDKLGGFADAIKLAATNAELGSKYDVRVYPKPKNFLEMLSEALDPGKADDEFVRAPEIIGSTRAKLMGIPSVAAGLEALRTIDPTKAKAVENFLIQAELLGKENVLVVDTRLSTMIH